MTDLYIDGTAVVLPAEFSTEIKKENSFLTKNGEYTYDIKLSLKNPTNAALYSRFLRVNSHNRLDNKRQAILVMDNKVIIKGLEIITDWTDDEVSIQLTSGNSELNYLIGADLKIGSLKMGSFKMQSDDNRVSLYSKTLNQKYPETDAVACPVYNLSAKTAINNWRLEIASDGTDTLRLEDDSPKIVQPFLCSYVKKVLTALGYQVGEFQLDDTVYAQLVMIHCTDTTDYAKMFSEVTVKDFFENLENLFNLVLVVNNREKVVDVVFASKFYLTKGLVYLEVEDEFDVEVDDDAEPLVDTAKLVYDLPNTPFYRAARLPDEIENMCTITTEYDLTAVNNFFKKFKSPKVICKESLTGRQYIYDPGDDPQKEPAYPIMEVNQFDDLKRDAAEIKISMVPAEMFEGRFNIFANGAVAQDQLLFPIPAVAGSADTNGEEMPNISDIILKGGAVNTDKGSSHVSLAFWLGKKDNLGHGVLAGSFPLCSSDNVVNLRGYGPGTVAPIDYTLNLEKMAKALQSGAYTINTKQKFTFYSNDPNTPDARSIFVIRNKRFVCREMVWNVTKGDKAKRWKIVCHPIQISDTAAFKRWVLEDGTWQDGGVWLADGRWNSGK